MKFSYFLKKQKLLFTVTILNIAAVTAASAQAQYQPYDFQFYQKLNAVLYSTNSNEHTALKPLFVDSLLKHSYDSLMNYGSNNQPHSWGYNKLFTEHLIDIKDKNSTFYGDLLPDFSVGRDLSGSKTTNLTSLGFQLGGTSGNKFYYNVTAYASSATFPNYLTTYINKVGIIPGQGYNRTPGQNTAEWLYFTAVASYTPSKFLNISLGQDKTFIGDGYRSMLLSDFGAPYPFFKLTATLGSVRYMAMWSDMNDPATTSPYHLNRRKFGVFHYLDWTINNRLSFGFFDNVIGFFTDDNGAKRPFDFNYINPLIFMKPINNSSDDPDKSLLGLTGKYKISNGVTVYGQFALDEFHSADFFSSNGATDNKYAWQLGLKGSNLFEIKNLNFLLETNNAKPYAYSARSAIENYSDNGEPLAHPWGANFRELVALLNYSYKRFNFSGEADFGRYGLDINGLNYGGDIFQLYTQPAKAYNNYTGQGLTTNMAYLEGKVAYMLNPKYNLRIELGGIFRDDKNTRFNDKTSMITIGLRSSFRNIYNDIVSYKTH